MKVQSYESIPSNPVQMEGASKCKVRQLINQDDGAPSFAMRQFTVEVGGHTPRHSHDYEHEVFVLEGTGTIYEGDIEHPLKPGDVVYVAPNEIHQFRNTGHEALKFLCLIPHLKMC